MALTITKTLRNSANRSSFIGNTSAFRKMICASYQSATGMKLVERSKFIAELLDLPEYESRLIVLKTRGVQRMNKSQLETMAAVFKKMQVTPEKIIEYPEILGHFPVQTEQRYLCLKELGLQPLGIPEILRYPTLIKRNAFDLKLMHLLPDCVDPLDHLLSQLPFLEQNFLMQHPKLRKLSLQNIRKVVLFEVLSQKLECQKKEVLWLLENCPILSNRSICLHLATIELLVNKLGFSIHTLMSCRYLLTIQPSDVEKVLANLPCLGGQSTTDFLQKYPKLLLVPADQILMTSDYLKQMGMSDVQIRNCWKIFSLPTSTVQERLNKILTKLPSDKVRKHPALLYNVYRNGAIKLTEKKSPKKLQENISYVSDQFNKNPDWIKQHLVKHPRLNLYHLTNCRDVLDYLLGQGFSKLQVEEALHLLMYSLDTVKTNLNNLHLHRDIEMFGDWKKHPYILNLMLYEIEKNLLRDKDFSKDDEELELEEEKELEIVEPNISQMPDRIEDHATLNYWKQNEGTFNNSKNENWE